MGVGGPPHWWRFLVMLKILQVISNVLQSIPNSKSTVNNRPSCVLPEHWRRVKEGTEWEEAFQYGLIMVSYSTVNPLP